MTTKNAAQLIVEEMAAASTPEEKFAVANRLSLLVYMALPLGGHMMPVGNIQWIHISKIHANDYNPNSVPTREMKLLHTSIDHDGYTQPVVTVRDPENDQYVIIDGFHRYTIMMRCPDIQEKTGGYLPIVVLDKDLNDRMASTVRHNRARGKHAVTGMSSMVYQMLRNGWKDAKICDELGMSVDELVRLKHVTGYSKLYEGAEYSSAWEVKHQIKARVEFEKANPEHPAPLAGGGDNSVS